MPPRSTRCAGERSAFSMIASTLVFRLDQVVAQYTCAQQSSPIRLLIVGQLNVTSATVCDCCYFLVVIVSVLGGADTLSKQW